ncbi:MAG: FAD-dependent oxidoreductase [Candidatus Pacearchaeota archaeon]
MVYDLIIIGAGPAGMTAAIYAARNKLKFLMISLDIGGQVSWSSEVDNYPGLPDCTGIEIVNKFKEHLKDYKIKVKIEEVKEIKKIKNFFKIKTKNKEYKTKTIILASGKKPKKLNVPGEEKFLGKGVSYCTTCEINPYKNKKVAIIGGGNSGLEAALFLTKHCKKVYVVEILDQINGEEFLKEKVKKNKKIKVITGARVKEILGNQKVHSIKYEKSNRVESLKIEGIFIEIGLITILDFAKIIKKNQWNEIMIFRSTKTHEENMTNIPGIFAAGDCTDIPTKQIVVAAGEGAKAALAAIDYINRTDKK